MDDDKNISMDKAYESKKFEKDIYQMWEEGGFFEAKVDKNRKPYVISMPPPNATGVLHLGHVVFISVSDSIVRYQRMKGKNVLWLPGTDHAAIATQTKVEKIVAKQEGKTRHDYGREKFVEKVKDFVENSRSTIREQLRRTGASCDWKHEAYTFSEELSTAVNTAFEKMYHDGLIYRGNRIVNWCPRCHSTLADDEIEYKEQKAVLYTFRYASDFPFEIATTRPETKLGDTAVAVNPDDVRYQKYIGQEFEVDFCGQKLRLKVIADLEVDMDFGTGALGVTPAHSYVDFDMAQKNNLPVIKVIDEDGKMNENAGEFAGMTVLEARDKVVECLKESGLMISQVEIDNNLSVCYRCETSIEPLTSEQWFVDVNKKITGWKTDRIKGLVEGEKYSLKDVSRMVVKSKQIRLLPDRFEKVYFGWMDNLRDWCVSRQIWWGHRIPVFYRKLKSTSEYQLESIKENDIYVGTNPSGEGWVQDEDTLDTWFSSGLWTFSSLGWPKQTPDLKYFHPTDLMVTGREIIFQWVARMILMSTYLVGEIPFRDVYLTGILYDKDGNKMSKSLGNAIDPLEMIDQYGTDALRLSVIGGIAPGVDFRFHHEKIVGQRNFVNKLWNVSRFIIANLDASVGREKIVRKNIEEIDLRDEDKWILSRLSKVAKSVSKYLDEYKLSLAIESLHEFIWSDLADWYVEMVKGDLNSENKQRKIDVQKILSFVLTNTLKLMHPFAPFVTEVIWNNLSKDGWGKLIVATWPDDLDFVDDVAEEKIKNIQEMVVGVRNLIADFGMANEKNMKVFLKFGTNVDAEIVGNQIVKLVKNISEYEVVDEIGDELVSGIYKIGSAGLEISQEVKEAQRKRVLEEVEKLTNYAQMLGKKLANENYVKNAPGEVVEKDRKTLAEIEEKLGELISNK